MNALRGLASVSDSMLGLWRRRSISLRDGGEDACTLVLWLQTARGVCDMRFPSERIDLRHRDCLEACTSDELIALANDASCFSGVTTLDEAATPYPTAVWEAGERGVRYQPRVEFDEPGWFEWRERGECMIEWAPSGAYQEDWRLEPHSRSRLLELTLESEPRTTKLFVAGDHAMYVRDRVCAVEAIRLPELARKRLGDHAALVALLDCEFSYAVQRAGRFVIEVSTVPFREGRELPLDWLWQALSEELERSRAPLRVQAPDGPIWNIESWAETTVLPGTKTNPM